MPSVLSSTTSRSPAAPVRLETRAGLLKLPPVALKLTGQRAVVEGVGVPAVEAVAFVLQHADPLGAAVGAGEDRGFRVAGEAGVGRNAVAFGVLRVQVSGGARGAHLADVNAVAGPDVVAVDAVRQLHVRPGVVGGRGRRRSRLPLVWPAGARGVSGPLVPGRLAGVYDRESPPAGGGLVFGFGEAARVLGPGERGVAEKGLAVVIQQAEVSVAQRDDIAGGIEGENEFIRRRRAADPDP